LRLGGFVGGDGGIDVAEFFGGGERGVLAVDAQGAEGAKEEAVHAFEVFFEGVKIFAGGAVGKSGAEAEIDVAVFLFVFVVLFEDGEG
jgi:hypothetical protein